MIGILTFQDTNNFGACLQALALYTRVRELGYDVEIIDYHNKRIYYNEVLHLRAGCSPRSFLRWLIYYRPLLKKYRLLSKEFRSLSNFSNKAYSLENIGECDGVYDTILVGSDQVWALNVTDYDYTYFLDFARKTKNKIAFSSSISDEESFRHDKHAQSLVASFNQIAVREEEAVKVILETTDRQADWVCDPTMLYTNEAWDSLIKPQSYTGNYVFIYFVDPENKIFKDAIQYATRYNCKVLYCGRMFVKGVKSVHPNTMSEWVGLIKHCKALFTASYHGLLFGLYYKKQLLYYNRNQKSRMQSISRLCKIEKNDGANINDGIIPRIDYNRVSEILEKFREQSDSVLKNMLKSHVTKTI